MNHRRHKLIRTVTALVALVTYAWTTPLDANDVQARVDGRAHARGVVLLRLTFPSTGEVWRVRLDTSRDGEEFREAGIGLPRAYQLFRSIAYDDRNTSVLVPAIAWFRTGKFFFDEPGNYWFRWGISFRDEEKPRTVPDQRDPNIEAVVVDQLVSVDRATEADLNFIERLAEPDLTRAMFGADFFERLTGNAIEHYADPEVRAVKVIGQLLSVTREKTPGQAIAWYGPHGDIRKAAEMLLALARDIPESNYAPYAAYYAGFCYVSIASNKLQDALRSQRTAGRPRDKIAETTQLVAFFQNDPDCAKTQESFTLAAQRADDYLKPRVLCQQAGLSVAGGAFDDAEKLLTRALEMAPGERTIQKWVDKTRKEADRMCAELEEGEERVSTTEEPGESE